MRVEAIRIENGFFIPMIDTLKNIRQDRIWVDISDEIEDDNYSFFASRSSMTDIFPAIRNMEIHFREFEKIKSIAHILVQLKGDCCCYDRI